MAMSQLSGRQVGRQGRGEHGRELLVYVSSVGAGAARLRPHRGLPALLRVAPAAHPGLELPQV